MARKTVLIILIGQLGKYIDEYDNVHGDTSADEMLTYVIEIIEEVVKVPCAPVILECKEDRKNYCIFTRKMVL